MKHPTFWQSLSPYQRLKTMAAMASLLALSVACQTDDILVQQAVIVA